jgi:hypothetical protein
MRKLTKLVLMLSLILSGALCYAHSVARTEYQKEMDGVPINMTVHGVTVQQDSQGNKTLSFQFPSHIRDIRQHAINNIFGDAVFILVRSSQGGPSPKE